MNSGSLGVGLRHQYIIKLPRKFRNSVKVENDCSASLMKTAVRKWGVTATHLCNDKCTPSTFARSLGNDLFSSAFFDFSFRLHLTFHALFLHCRHLLSLQMAHTEMISNQNSYLILHMYLVQIFSQKPARALPALSLSTAPGGSDSITKPAVWKHASIRAYQMIKEGWNGFKFPLHHLVLETNYSHTIASYPESYQHF